MNASKLHDLTDWLIDGGRSATSPTRFMAETCERMVAAGLPLWRVGVFVRTLHPDIYGRNFIWKPGAEVQVGSVDFKILESPDFHNSPIIIVFQQGREVHARADDPRSARFPIVEELRAEGVTDYVALPLPFINGTVNASSWTTKQPGGFTDEQLAALRKIVTPLARVIEIISLTRTAASLLDTYVGNRAGERILGGQIRRGHTETMNAAIWLSDLRGFTSLSDRVPPETVVEILNNYFDCQVAAIRAHGGEVLKYMGDGLLAVFPIDEYVGDERQVCAHVLEAAHESRASVADMQYPIGDAVERFRIGPAVNLAARLERIASRLQRTIVASEGFAGICRGGWSDLGEFPVAGFAKTARVYGLLDETSAA
jgi:adenylate cyclase